MSRHSFRIAKAITTFPGLCVTVAVRLHHHPGQTMVRIEVAGSAIERWTLGLCLLKEELLESMTVSDPAGDLTLVLQQDRNLRNPCCVDPVAGRRVSVRFSTVEMDRWCVFYLTCCRDGIAAVDHIEVDSIGKAGVVTVLGVAPSSKPPLSESEARRRLND